MLLYTTPTLTYNDVIYAEVSAYTSSVNETDDTPFLTASGKKVNHMTIACPSVYSFGTEIRINGFRYFCEDRMNKRYRDGNYFDIWFEDREKALEFGRQKLFVEVIRR